LLKPLANFCVIPTVLRGSLRTASLLGSFDFKKDYFVMEKCGPKIKAITKAESVKENEFLDSSKMFSDLWWLNYCICRGIGIGNFGAPLFGSEGKNLCIHQSCQCDEVGNPFCKQNVTECCITSQCEFPPAKGSPTCVCFNKKLAGGETTEWKQNIFEAEYGFGDQFWVYYFICAGCSVHAMNANKRSCIQVVRKNLCIKEMAQSVQPVGEDGNFCSAVGTSLCFWEQCAFPPASEADGNPMFTCFNMCRVKNKDKTGGKLCAYGKAQS
jgi:hypothetical protein